MKNAEQTVILHICNYAAPYRGNFINSLCSLEQYHTGIKNVYLFPYTLRNNENAEWFNELNSEETVAYCQEGNVVKNIQLVATILKKHRVTHIATHFSDLKMDFIIKLLFNSNKVIRFFHNVYRPDPSSKKHRIRKICWKNNLLVGVSQAVSTELKKLFPDFQIATVINAIYFERLAKPQTIEKNGEITLLMMGWDYKGKGVDLAVKATEQIQKTYNVQLNIVAAIHEKEIKEYCFKVLGKEVDWVKVLPPTDDIAQYYYGADIFVSPSRSEAFCYAAVEASYCGNSLVASKVDGQAELQIDGAYWFESENIEDLCHQLERAISELNMAETKEKKEKAKMTIKTLYSLKRWSTEIIELL